MDRGNSSRAEHQSPNPSGNGYGSDKCRLLLISLCLITAFFGVTWSIADIVKGAKFYGGCKEGLKLVQMLLAIGGVSLAQWIFVIFCLILIETLEEKEKVNVVVDNVFPIPAAFSCVVIGCIVTAHVELGRVNLANCSEEFQTFYQLVFGVHWTLFALFLAILLPALYLVMKCKCKCQGTNRVGTTG